MSFTFKQRVGAAILDWPRYEWHIRGARVPGLPSGHWSRMGNRRDRLQIGPGGWGVNRVGPWTSRIHVVDVFPSLGSRLMRTALREWPVGCDRVAGEAAETPEVSFVIGHRGRDRLDHLDMVLKSIAAQVDVDLECVVVEQSVRREIRRDLPDWVRIVHAPPPFEAMPYSRSWAFNVGAREARGRLLVFHDNDMLVPRDYASELRRLQGEGWEVINLKRFVFYLSRDVTRRTLETEVVPEQPRLDAVVQNLEGGGSIAVDRMAFYRLGGFDEAFVGWGGEDNEFWQRAKIRPFWPYGYLPIVHLWHASQPKKGARDRHTARLLEERSRISPFERAAELAERDFGRLEGPDPPWTP